MANVGTHFEGVVFAPRGENGEVSGPNTAFPTAQSQCEMGGYYADICIGTGNTELDGAVIGGPVAVKQASRVTFDPDLTGQDITIRTDTVVAPPLSFLHVSVNTVTVDGPMGVGPTATPPTPNEGVQVTFTPDSTETPTGTPSSTPSANGYPPSAEFSQSRNGNSKNVNLDAASSSDSDGYITKYEWKIGTDGSFEEGSSAVQQKVTAGTQVTLRVTDDDGNTDTVTKTIS